MKEIEKSYLACILGLEVMEYILAFFTWGFYLILPLLNIHLQKISYNDKRIIIEKGILNKTHENIELYKFQNISAKSNIFGYGSILFTDKMKSIRVYYIKNPQKYVAEFLELRDEAQKNRGIVHNEVF